jgi:hypothetical protein
LFYGTLTGYFYIFRRETQFQSVNLLLDVKYLIYSVIPALQWLSLMAQPDVTSLIAQPERSSIDIGDTKQQSSSFYKRTKVFEWACRVLDLSHIDEFAPIPVVLVGLRPYTPASSKTRSAIWSEIV